MFRVKPGNYFYSKSLARNNLLLQLYTLGGLRSHVKALKFAWFSRELPQALFGTRSSQTNFIGVDVYINFECFNDDNLDLLSEYVCDI